MNTQYTTIGTDQAPHIKELINWLIAEVISAGGDGDALWYSHYYHVDEILPILQECKIYDFSIDKKENSIIVGKHQEWLIITNNQEDWNNAPSWQQVKIWY
jgi:hypothetical protein